MCNLYSLTKGQDAIRQLAKAMRDTTGDLPPLPAIFPDQVAPVVRLAKDGERELTMMRWGFPPPRYSRVRLVTNVRDVTSPYWRGWLRRFRCLVPATSFCEYTDTTPKVPHWFALDESRPIFFFAGIWRPWTGSLRTRVHPALGKYRLYAFLTCEANEIVERIRAKDMPVLLTTEEEADQWLTAEVHEALELQRPLPSDQMKIVAKGERKDEAA
jgi:putative SOS response-associated peptidase YedK